jgi:hypothetical protein
LRGFGGRRLGRGVEADCLSQASLALIEGPEALGFQLEGAGYMQRIESADAESGAVTASQIGTNIPSGMGELDHDPQAGDAIALEFRPDFLRFDEREAMQKDLPINGICEFREVERRNENANAEGHAPITFC